MLILVKHTFKKVIVEIDISQLRHLSNFLGNSSREFIILQQHTLQLRELPELGRKGSIKLVCEQVDV